MRGVRERKCKDCALQIRKERWQQFGGDKTTGRLRKSAIRTIGCGAGRVGQEADDHRNRQRRDEDEDEVQPSQAPEEPLAVLEDPGDDEPRHLRW